LLYNVLAIVIYFIAPFVILVIILVEGIRQLFWIIPLRIYKKCERAYRRHEICDYLRKQINLLEKQNDKRRNKR